MVTSLTNQTPPAGSVGAEQLAAGAVTTPAIADLAVTPDKAAKATRRDPLVVNSREEQATGTTATVVKTADFAVTGGPGKLTDFCVAAELKSGAGTDTATIEIYIDAEASPRATLTNAAAADKAVYDMVATGDVDASDLANGKHTVTAKLKSSAAAGVAYNRQFDLYTVRG